MNIKPVIAIAILPAFIMGSVACGGGSQPPASTATAVPPAPTIYSGSDDGERLDYFSNSLYYLPSVTQQEAQRLLDYLVQEEFFAGGSEADLQLRKEGGAYEVRMPLKEGIDPTDADLSDLFKLIACDLETDVFSGSGVDWIAVDVSFENITARYVCF